MDWAILFGKLSIVKEFGGDWEMLLSRQSHEAYDSRQVCLVGR